jgi:hypothetical protein
MTALSIVIRAGAVVVVPNAPLIDAVVRDALANRVDGGHTVGIVGLATIEGRTFAAHRVVAKCGEAPTKDTGFEIGSFELLTRNIVVQPDCRLECIAIHVCKSTGHPDGRHMTHALSRSRMVAKLAAPSLAPPALGAHAWTPRASMPAPRTRRRHRTRSERDGRSCADAWPMCSRRSFCDRSAT